MRIRNIATTAISAGIAASLALSGMLTPVTAFAANSVTITDSSNAGATFDAFMVVSADMNWDSNLGLDKASRVQWASNAMKGVVLTFIDSVDTNPNDGMTDYQAWLCNRYNVSTPAELPTISGVESPHDNPQNAAEFISERIGIDGTAPGSPDAVMDPQTDPRTTQANSFANDLARALVAARTAGTINSVGYSNAQGTFTGNQEGYYLLITTPSTIDVGEAGTAPIWVSLSEHDKEFAAKTAIPTCTKYVKDDATGSDFDKVADVNVGQDLEYKVLATLPANYDAFPTYAMTFTDTLPATMTIGDGSSLSGNALAAAGVHVYLENTVVVDEQETTQTQELTDLIKSGQNGTMTYANDVLTIAIPNTKVSWGSGVNVDANSRIYVTYPARLEAGATPGTNGSHVNTAKLTYTADPNTDATKDTPDTTARALTYQLKLTKVDEATRQPLANAQFQVTALGEDGTTVYYIATDGSRSLNEQDAGVFTSNASGEILIPGLDEGTYYIQETVAPDHYEVVQDPAVVTITATKDQQNMSISALTASYSGGIAADNDANVPAADNKDGITEAPVIATGLVSSRLSDVRQIVMPLTGMTGRNFALTVGAIIAGVSLVVVIRNRMRDSQED